MASIFVLPVIEIEGLRPLKPVDILTTNWKALALLYAVQGFLYSRLVVWLLSQLPWSLLWHFPGVQITTAINRKLPTLFWLFWLFSVSLDDFEKDFQKAWRDEFTLSQKRKVTDLVIFVGGNPMLVPIAFDKETPENNSDAETFKHLRMWYSWMQFKRGLGEMIIPRRLVRIDKVEFCSTSLVLGERIKTYDLGRNAASNVVNFLDASRIDPRQHFQTDSMLSDPQLEGLEFVRAWDRRKISAITMIPFVISLLFAVIWIPVSVARYAVDQQVAVQTDFTVASYIVTAGALLIALFAFLDGSAN